MTKQNKTKTVTLWTARITGTLILLFILFFLLAHIFGDDESGEGFRSTFEVITFVFFPITPVLGLILAYKWEGLGGMVTTLGMLGLFVMRPELMRAFYVAIPLVPGILYIIYWAMNRYNGESAGPKVS